MKQIFEVFFSVVLMLVVVFLSAQGITTNTQISTAREYHNTVIERIENTGLSEDYVNSIVDYTNNNTDYTLTVKKVNGTRKSNFIKEKNLICWCSLYLELIKSRQLQ